MTLRTRPKVLPGLLLTLIASLLVPFGTVAAGSGSASVGAPATATTGELFALTLTLPSGVAAFDGRVLVAGGAAEVVGLAPDGAGTGFRPAEITGGYAIGAYGLSGQTVDLVVAPNRPGRLQLRVAIDMATDAAGVPLDSASVDALVTVRVSGGNELLAAPSATGRDRASRRAGQPKELIRDGRFDSQDLDIARGDWQATHSTGAICDASTTKSGDANADGCVDIADVQALNARLGQQAASGATSASSAKLAAAAVHTFVVTSPMDTPDATPGDAICADSLGRCTLRAAIREANWMQGEDRIEFNLPGPAPVTIQIGSGNGYMGIVAQTGGVIIDGYTQPGSSPNTAAFGSNAVPGVEVRGNGFNAQEFAFYITSPNNTIRGLVLGNLHRGIFMDGVNAHDNHIIGNWIGFTRTGTNSASGRYGIVPNIGANHNFIGSPDLADRNVIGNWGAGIDVYGPGSDFTTTQNNLFCIRPNGLTATCSTAIDHNFGPKNGLFGGSGPNERNYIGPTTLQGIEYSHGWNPANHVGSPTYEINNNRTIGNWVGFRADGTYSATYRSGLNFSSADNGQAINVYDGSNDNLVEGNYIAAVYDGIQFQSANANRNIARNNFIGISPLGENAPLTRWGVIVRLGTADDIVENNTIRNAAAGGVGLVITNNSGTGGAPAHNIRISRNIINNTNGPAIDLFGVAGPDPNDVGDGDAGANGLLNSPVITQATTTAIRGTAEAGSTVEVYRASRAVGSYGLPIEYFGSAVTAGNGQWTLARISTLGDIVTALQIATSQNTSELAANVAVGATAPQAPTFTSAASTSFAVGSAGTFSVTTTGFPTPAISRTGTLPSGVTFTDNGNGSGTLAGTPAAGTAGTYPITFTATNGVAPNATQNFVLTVNQAPAFTSAASTSFLAGSAGTFSVTTTGSPTAAISRTGTLPSGVTFTDNGNGTGTLAGTPGPGTAGTYPITFTATNGVAPNATQNFTLTITAPPPGAPIVDDTFSRTVADGWGTAPTGGAYTLTGTAADFDVAGGLGTMNMAAGANRTAALGSVSGQDVEVSFRVTTDRTPTVGSLYLYGNVRRVSSTNAYRVKLRIAPNGQVFVHASQVINNTESAIGSEVLVPGLTNTPGSFIRLRAQVTGTNPTTIRVRAWADGGTEPAGWQYTGTNSAASLQAAGGVGLQAYLSGTVGNPPVLVSFDDFLVTPLP